jgi:hypothetical protein
MVTELLRIIFFKFIWCKSTKKTGSSFPHTYQNVQKMAQHSTENTEKSPFPWPFKDYSLPLSPHCGSLSSRKGAAMKRERGETPRQSRLL